MTADVLQLPWSRAVADECGSCARQHQCFMAQLLPEENGDCTTAVRRRYLLPNGEFLFRRDTRFSAVFLVCRGSVKTQRVTPEGGLVVTGFYLDGDVVGLDAMGDTHHPCDAIATADTELCRLNFQHLLNKCSAKPGVQSWIISRIALYMRKKEMDLSWSMGMNAHVRILRFFLELYERLHGLEVGQGNTTVLPMKKQDISRYLHITPETLSRNLAMLRKQDLLLVANDQFSLPHLNRARQMTQL